MPQWVVGYVAGFQNGLTAIALDVPGPLRRINAGFYLTGNNVQPHPLTPVITANGADEVQITDPTTSAGKRSVSIFIVGGVNHIVVFLFVEIELDVPGPKQAITP